MPEKEIRPDYRRKLKKIMKEKYLSQKEFEEIVESK